MEKSTNKKKSSPNTLNAQTKTNVVKPSVITETGDSGEIGKRKKKNQWIAISGLMVTIITLAFTVYIFVHGQKTETEKLLEQNSSNAEIIEKSFKLSGIIIDSASAPDIYLVRDFQISALKMVSHWRSICNMVPISNFKALAANEIIEIAKSQLDVKDTFDNGTKTFLDCIKAIGNYGERNNISAFMPPKDRIAFLRELELKRTDFTTPTRNALGLESMMSQYDENTNKVNNSSIIKELTEQQKKYKEKAFLEYIDGLFTTIIELDNRYMSHINQMNPKENR